MTREEIMGQLLQMEEQVEKIEQELKNRVNGVLETRCNNVLSKKRIVLTRLNLLEEGANYLLTAAPVYKMVQSF